MKEGSPKIVEEYFWFASNHLEYSTTKEYVRLLNIFAAWLNPENPKEADLINVPAVKINEFMETWVKYNQVEKEKTGELKLNSYSHRNRFYSVLKGFYEYLVEEEYIIKTPVSKYLRIKKQDEIPTEVLTLDEIKLLLEHVKTGRVKSNIKRNYLMISLLCVTGIRKSALCSINIDDLDTETNTLIVKDKGSKVHKYYLSDKVVDLWDDYINDEREKRVEETGYSGDAMFLSNKGLRLTERAFDQLLEGISKRALGRKISPHKLRASYITEVYNVTHDIEKTRYIAGHAKIETTILVN